MGNSVMDAHIYCVTNLMNGKQYVGQTTVNRNKVGHGQALKDAYNKYGKHQFSYERVCTNILNRDTLNYLERFWISVCDTVSPYGYNIERGGTDKNGTPSPKKGIKLSEEIRNKSKHTWFQKGHITWNKGIPALPHVIEASRLANLGKKHSDHTKELHSIRMTGYVYDTITCPHCNTSGGATTMKRWHFDNCTGAKYYRSRVTVNGKRIHLGRYASKEEAFQIGLNYYMENNISIPKEFIRHASAYGIGVTV